MTALDHLDDDQLSTLVDGDGPPLDAEHARECPDCGSRLDAMLHVREMVAAAPAAPSTPRRETAIAAALAAASELEGEAAGDSAAGVTWLDRRRRPWTRQLMNARAAAVAAVVVVAAGAGTTAALVAGSGGGSGRVASSAGTAARTPAAAAPTEKAPGGAAIATLGSMSSPGPLLEALRARVASGTAPSAAALSPPTSAVAAVIPCLSQAKHLAAAGSSAPALVAQLTYQRSPATAFVFPVGDRHVAVVTANAGCALLTRLTW